MKKKVITSKYPLYELIEFMRKIKTNIPDAKLNAISMKDKDGNRIYY